MEITAEISGNYPNFKQIYLKKLCRLKSQRKPTAAWQMQSQSSKVRDDDNQVAKRKKDESGNKKSSHCCTDCLLCPSIQVKCITWMHAERP